MSAEAVMRVVIAAARAGVEPSALSRRAGGPEALLRASARRLDRLGAPERLRDELRRARTADIDAYRLELAGSGTSCVTVFDQGYPAGLHDLHDPPLAVFLRGALPLAADRPAVAIVGARRSSDTGLRLARRLGGFAAGAGVAVVSGMALGIDGAAHAGALDAGGVTVAVLGCGTDIAYPRSHRGLYARILEHGLAVSEYPPGTAPAPWRFPARNRLIAALARTVVIVEARVRSGALITADHALDLGRDVVAVPGAAGSSASAGTNGLIKSGAGLVEDEADLSVWLGIDAPAAPPPPADPAARRVLEGLSGRPAYADDIAAATGLGPGSAAALLSRLEIDGWLARDASGRYILARSWTPSAGPPSTATAR
ncbi:MAG TPA: DNA-processing protein DprA [Gaiellales bacterium]